MMISRRSLIECSSSSKIRAKGSAKAVRASSNDTLCLETLLAAFLGSHWNFRYCPSPVPYHKDDELLSSRITQAVRAGGAGDANLGCMALKPLRLCPSYEILFPKEQRFACRFRDRIGEAVAEFGPAG